MNNRLTPRPSLNPATLAILSLAFVLAAPVSAWGQSDTKTEGVGIQVDEIAILAIFGEPAPSFTITAPAIAGQSALVKMFSPGDGHLLSTDQGARYLQFTSVVESGKKRTIAVSHSGLQPALTLRLLIDPSVLGEALGNTGNRVTQFLSLTTAPLDAISDIGSGFTGFHEDPSSGELNGWRFRYDLIFNNFGALVAATNTEVIVTFTLTAGS